MVAQLGTRVDAPIVAGNNSDDDIASALNPQIQGGLKFFATEADMRRWSDKYKTRVFGSVAFVLQNTADQEPQAFRWDGTQEDGSDGKWADFEFSTVDLPTAGIAFVKPDGSTVTGIELLALSGLTLSGNEKDGFTLSVTGGSGITVEERVKYAEYDNIQRILIGPGLELNAIRDKQDGPATGVEIGIKPMTFQPRSTTGYLAYLQYPEVIVGKAKAGDKYRKGTLWMDMVAVSSNGMLQEDRQNKAIGLQDVDMLDDPNISGGSKFLVWPFVYLEGEAPDDGYVELVWYNKQTGAIATDINGHAMAVRHNYKQGQTLTPKHDPLTFCQVIAAKGITEYSLAVVDSFDDFIRVLDYAEGPTGLCIQELSKNGNASEALIKAEIDTGFNVRVEAYHAGTYLANAGYYANIPISSQTVSAGSFVHSASEFEMYAVTDIDYGVSNGLIQVQAHDGNIGDFYFGLVVNPQVTRAIAGHDLTANVSLIDKNNAWKVEFYNYSGDLDKRPPLYKSRNNGAINLEAGWSKFGSGFISEDVVSGLHTQSFTATVPKDADFVMVAMYPVTAQNPLSISLKAFNAGVAPAIDAYEINSLNIAGLHHLDFMTETVKLVQDTQGYAALRYTINDAPDGNPMPFGVPQSKMKFLHLDKSLNVISGSSAKGGEGALVDDQPCQVKTYQKWQLYNEQADAHQVDFWLMVHRDGDGSDTEVAGSRTTFSVDPKRPGVDYFQTNEATVQLEPGDYIYARSRADTADGAYAQTTNKASPLCIAYITEKGLAP